jgi:hypothetical protein
MIRVLFAFALHQTEFNCSQEHHLAAQLFTKYFTTVERLRKENINEEFVFIITCVILFNYTESRRN